MLVLTRQIEESVVIQVGDETIIVKVIEVSEGRCRLRFDAPRHISIDRQEVYESKNRSKQ